MKFVIGLIFLFALNLFPLMSEARGGSHSGSVHVDGYTKSNGTYVAPHYRSAPNGTTSDNWSHKGNVNPYNGKVGTQND